MSIDVKTLYDKNDYGWWYDYQPMLNAFGTIIIQVDDHDYQGDSRLLYQKGDQFGVLIFGWGSCSGCDALQACGSLEEVQKLCNSLQNQIIWFNSAEDALLWFKTHDWRGSFLWSASETKEFIDKCIEYLKE